MKGDRMEVICNNCGGSFDSSEDKCPYCGSIYEPGAEKKYMETLEGIKKNLDRVNDDVVINAKNEVKRFFKSFIVSALTVTVLWLIMFLGLKKDEKDWGVCSDRNLCWHCMRLNCMHPEGHKRRCR